jgi:hypothetical protein
MNPAFEFDPQQLDSNASLNQTVLRNEPSFDEDVRGRPAGALLSSAALNDAVRSNATALGLTDEALSRTSPVALLNGCLDAADGRIGAAAREVAERFGRHLGFLLVTLIEGAADRWPGRQPYFRHWTTIRHVRLAGGNVRGALGGAICASACRTLAAYGHSDLDVQVAPYPESLPLVGAARSLQAPVNASLVYDFGGTFVKHGRAAYDGAPLTEVSVLDTMPAMFLRRPGRRAVFRARQLALYMTGLIAQDWRNITAGGAELSPDVLVAIGSYIRDGQMLSSRYQTYGMLDLLPARQEVWLSEVLSHRIGAMARVTLSHDGTTAARVFAGQAHTAVIMLGTWLGVGFAPEDASRLRPLARDFAVT